MFCRLARFCMFCFFSDCVVNVLIVIGMFCSVFLCLCVVIVIWLSCLVLLMFGVVVVFCVCSSGLLDKLIIRLIVRFRCVCFMVFFFFW